MPAIFETENGQKLQQRLQHMAAAFAVRENWVLVTNYDADGLSAGGILSQVFKRAGKKSETVILKQLYQEHLQEIIPLGKNYFFVDLGAGQLDFLKAQFGENFFVLDHHQPLPLEHALHANPLLFGFDGGKEISAAGMAFLFGLAVNSQNKDLASLAIVGALGDMQDEDGKLIGLNEWICEQGIAAGVVEKKTDIRLYGRTARPLVQFLAFASAPVLPGLTANETNCIAFLQQLGIDLKDGEEWLTYEMLPQEQKKALVSALILHLHEQEVSDWKIRSLIGTVYSLPKEKNWPLLYDAKAFGTMLNACGRHHMAEIGLSVCMGDRSDHYSKALSLLAEHRKQLREGIQFLQEQGVQEKKQYYFFDAEHQIKDSIVGIVAGMVYGSGTIGFNKPIIAFGRYADNSIKVSGRGTTELVRSGLNLGKAFHEICEELGFPDNTGGGHKIAAGCKIEEKNKELFLELLEQQLSEQLRPASFSAAIPKSR